MTFDLATQNSVQRYYIALFPEPDISQQLLNYQQQANSQFGVCYAMRSPPHLTLIRPSLVNDTQLAEIKINLSTISQHTTAFELSSSGWGHFKQRTIYLAINDSKPLLYLKEQLDSIAKQLIAYTAESKFTPHLSLINRDITTSLFPEIWQWTQQLAYPKLIKFTQLVILRHQSSSWTIEQSFPLI